MIFILRVDNLEKANINLARKTLFQMLKDSMNLKMKSDQVLVNTVINLGDIRKNLELMMVTGIDLIINKIIILFSFVILLILIFMIF